MSVRYKLPFAILLVLTSLNASAASARVKHSPVDDKTKAARQESDFALKDGDRVLFYGDSITEQRLYTTYVEHYVLTHYPERRITFINTGWGGDQVTRNECEPCHGVGALARLKRDVIDHQPTVVTLLFGMNDGRYYDFDEATMKVYTDGLMAIIHELKAKTKARMYVMTPTVYDGTRNTPWSHTSRYNDVLDRYSEAAKQIAAREQLPIIDLHTVTAEALMLAKKSDSSYTFLPDGVHPEADGQLVMAAEILRAWGAPAGGVEVTRQVRVDVGKPTTLTFTAPLTWPEPLPSEKLRAVCPQITEMGKVTLHVTGLAPGEYKVSVDGGNAVNFTADELARGIAVNQASRISEEASRVVASAVRQRADLFFKRWRQIEVPYASQQQAGSSALTGPYALITNMDMLIAKVAEGTRAVAAAYPYQVVISRVQ